MADTYAAKLYISQICFQKVVPRQVERTRFLSSYNLLLTDYLN